MGGLTGRQGIRPDKTLFRNASEPSCRRPQGVGIFTIFRRREEESDLTQETADVSGTSRRNNALAVIAESGVSDIRVWVLFGMFLRLLLMKIRRKRELSTVETK